MDAASFVPLLSTPTMNIAFFTGPHVLVVAPCFWVQRMGASRFAMSFRVFILKFLCLRTSSCNFEFCLNFTVLAKGVNLRGGNAIRRITIRMLYARHKSPILEQQWRQCWYSSFRFLSWLLIFCSSSSPQCSAPLTRVRSTISTTERYVGSAPLEPSFPLLLTIFPLFF